MGWKKINKKGCGDESRGGQSTELLFLPFSFIENLFLALDRAGKGQETTSSSCSLKGEQQGRGQDDCDHKRDRPITRVYAGASQLQLVSVGWLDRNKHISSAQRHRLPH